jgi:hypothetical protein
MWLLLLFVPGLVFLLVGRVPLGDVFTRVMVPVAVFAALSAVDARQQQQKLPACDR